ncbi:MAG: glutaminyl-peptide cyclotransferase [Sedimentisphaerales bacterium]|nr:glutaminyl-peptide cyclotransferase [Sedimentisphaerales bacterium]
MKKREYITFLLLLIIFTVVIITYMINKEPSVSQFYGYEIVNTFPHDTNAFTQGLIYEDGVLYEGTGQYGYSSIRKVELETGKILQIYHMPDEYFGEGITIWKDKIIQLTWQSETGFVYDKHTFEPQREFSYRSEGWGITHDGEHLIMSDGSPTLYFLDPETYEVVSKLAVYYGESMLKNLNELEYINGKVFANIWGTEDIVIINPQTGQVESMIELDGLLNRWNIQQQVDVLNGIAYDAKNKRLFVTGKWWPNLFEIKLVPKKID